MRWEYCLIALAVFDAIVYVYMWYDDSYYKHNLGEKFKKIRDCFTEE